MCGVKLVDKRDKKEQMEMLELREAPDVARANSVGWCGHVLGLPEQAVLMKKMVHEVDGKRKQGRSKVELKERRGRLV